MPPTGPASHWQRGSGPDPVGREWGARRPSVLRVGPGHAGSRGSGRGAGRPQREPNVLRGRGARV
eukprot:6516907-Alexandrium_andersonii.AAC.1